MKSAVIVSFSFLMALLFAQTELQAQRNPRATARLEKGGQFVMVEYGRPSLKGRDMLAQLQPGKVWRMGADKSTTFTCSSNISFGKISVPQGSYSLWLRKVDDKNFQLVVNKTTGQWGTEHDMLADFASIALTLTQNSESVEQFTINFKETPKGGDMELLWGTTILKTSFQFK
jgi:Protein of unknown function (DUF2911)